MATTKSKVSTPKSDITTESSAVAVFNEAAADNRPAAKKQYKVKQDLNPNSIITVKNGFQGRLIYISKRTQERFIWDNFCDEQDMELQELKNAKNSSKAYFENNWFLIDDPEIIEYLGVSRYYKNALSAETFDELFDKPADEVRDIVNKLSAGQKKSVAFRAKQKIAAGEIDSIKVITALEDALSTELIDR